MSVNIRKIEKQSLEANIASACPSTIQCKGSEHYPVDLLCLGLSAGLGFFVGGEGGLKKKL